MADRKCLKELTVNRIDRRLGLIALLAVGLAGCATPVYNYSPKRIDISEPPLMSVQVAHVGDNMIRQGTFAEHESIYVHEDTDIGFLAPYTVRRGYYLKKGEDESSGFFLPSPIDGGEVVKAALADSWKVIQAYKAEAKLCVVTFINASVCADGARFERRFQPIESRDSFQQTLIYNGKVGDKINVGYREFSGNVARPAFSNQVEYDLKESRVVGYKGARIEILEATNQYIRYKVLRNFNAAKQ